MDQQDQLLDSSLFQQPIEDILSFLFDYQPPELKSKLYPRILEQFESLDLVAHYLLFSLIEKKLPHRARMLFCGENYQGKRETLFEIFAHLSKH